AERVFGAVTGHIFTAGGVALHVADGRAWLVAPPLRYDLITVDGGAPWSAAAAPLYTRELYQLAAAALADGGVLAQSLPLGRLAPRDLAAAIAAARAVFPEVALYATVDRGTLVACL